MDIKKRMPSFKPAPFVPPASRLASTTALHIAHCAADSITVTKYRAIIRNNLITIFSLFFLVAYTQPSKPLHH